MGAVRDDYSDAERNPSDSVLNKKDCGWYYYQPVSNIAEEWDDGPFPRGYVQRTMPYGGAPCPAPAAGTAQTIDNTLIDSQSGDADGYNTAATSTDSSN